MIASLPMYWRAETAAAWQRFWATVQAQAARAGVDLPDLTPPDDLPADWADHWRRPDLMLSQTCGLPFRTTLKDQVSYVATFDFGLRCAPGYYHSCAILRADRPHGFRATSLAYNAADSQSGWAAVHDHTAFDRLLVTGAHEASARAVAEGRADIAYLDAVTWRLLERFTDLGTHLRVADRTPPTPGLPLITAKGRDPDPLRRALDAAVRTLSPDEAADLGGLKGLAVLDPADYYAVPLPPAPESVAKAG